MPSTLAGSGIIIENTGSTTLSIPENPSIRLHFQSGATRVTGVTYFSGSTTWRGGFILGEKIEKDLFLPETAILVDDNRTLPRQNVSQIMKLGADRRGVGMQLNQSLGLEFTGLTPGLEYRVISSEDGIRWSDIELSGKKYSVDVSGSIIVMTNHFSYFALLSTANIIEAPPTCIISANP